MHTSLNLIIGLLFLLMLIFQNRILRLLKLDPNRARDFFGFIAAYLLLILIYLLVSSESFGRHKLLFLVGLLTGIFVSVLQDYIIFRKLEDNILSMRWSLRTFIGMLFGLGIGIWAAKFGAFTEILWFMVGFCCMGSFIRVAYILRYEKKSGLLMIRKS
jgi:hypothetical protein